MLVKRSIVERWYQTDSWVYGNFAYLFKNPLWQKRIPRGFSVCPYFWLNLFSFFIFRPFFVAPIQYVFSPLIRGLGKPAKWVDDHCQELLRALKMGGSEPPTGAATMLILVLFLLVGCIAGAATLGVIKIVALGKYLYSLDSADHLGIFAYWSALSFAGLFGVIGLHKLITKTECQTMYYLFVWLALFIVACFVFIPHDIITGTGIFFSVIGTGIWAALKAVGSFLAWAGIGCGKGLAWFFMLKPFYLIPVPWWGYFVALTIVGYFSTYILDKWEQNTLDNYRSSGTEGMLHFRRAWTGLFYRILMESRAYKSGSAVDSLFGEEYLDKACVVLRQELYERAIEILYGEQLNTLQSDYPLLKQGGWKAVANSNGSDERFSELNNQLDKTPANRLRFDSYEFLKAMRQAAKEPGIKAQLNQMATHYKNNSEAALKRRQEWLNSWHHKACLQVTGAIADFVRKTGRGLRFLFTNLGTFLAYMWMLIKAKKQGACPYMTFTEPVAKQPAAK